MFDKLVDLFVSCLHLFQFWTVVPQYAEGLVLRLGKLNRLAGPGFHFLWPFHIEVVLSTNVLPETVLIGPQSLTTQDDQSIVISTVVTFSVADVEKFLLHVDGAKQAMEDTVYGLVASIVMGKSWQELVTGKLANEITIAARRAAKKYGVEIINVQLADFTRSRSYRLLQHVPSGHTGL